MGFRFRRSIRLGKGLRINLSKSGASLSAGRRGATMNFGPKGTKATIGIPGTGVSWSTRVAPATQPASHDDEPAMPNELIGKAPSSSRVGRFAGWLLIVFLAAVIGLSIFGTR